MGGENRKIPIFCWFCWPRLISRELCFMGYPGENRRLSEDTVSTLEMHHAFLQQFRAELAGSLKHEKATGWLSRRSKGENSLLSRSIRKPGKSSKTANRPAIRKGVRPGELVGHQPCSITLWWLVRVRPAPPRSRAQLEKSCFDLEGLVSWVARMRLSAR